MKILLVKPQWYVNGDPMSKFRDFNRVPPLSLGLIAALSEDCEVEIVDEDFKKIPYSNEYDLVGITVVTFTAKRAYAISQRFRELGVPVVLGGVHPSLMPQESLQFADSVVVGEAEPVWRQVLDDVRKKQLKQIYTAGAADINDVPVFPVVGCAVVVGDAHFTAVMEADIVLTKPGGHGAVREFCDMIIKHVQERS